MGFRSRRRPTHFKENTRMKDRGFSLLELLIVVAIILIIATIAIPSLLRSRQSAQESAAVAQVRTVNTAEITYLSSNQGSYGGIAELITQGLLDTRPPSRTKDSALMPRFWRLSIATCTTILESPPAKMLTELMRWTLTQIIND